MPASAEEIARLRDLALQVRKDIIGQVHAAGSGHPGGSLSSADLATVLYAKFLRHRPEAPDWADPAKWMELAGGVLVRRDHPEAAGLHWDALEEPGEPCGCCGSLDKWEDYNGAWHCGRCDATPLDVARRLAERAAALRRRNPPKPKAKIPRGGG